jgi:hypothetical protein
MKLKTVQKEQSDNKDKPLSEIVCFSKFKKSRMVTLKGNFRGFLNLSQNKVQAILEHYDDLKDFAEGMFDNQIDALEANQQLEVE